LEVYPNPTSDIIYINSLEELSSPAEIEVYSLSGQLIRTYSTSLLQRFEINLSQLATGSYLLSIRTGGQEESLLIQKMP
jgi:hypothetical protein